MTNRKTSSIVILLVGIIISVIFVTIGAKTEIPKREIDVGYEQSYVGGDAYNYIIESNVLASEITSAELKKTIYISVGSILFMMSIIGFNITTHIENKNKSNNQE